MYVYVLKCMLQMEMQMYIILSCDVYSFGHHIYTTDHCQPRCLALTRWAWYTFEFYLKGRIPS